MSLLYFFDLGSSHQPAFFLIMIFFKTVFKLFTLSFLYRRNLILNNPIGVIKSPSFFFFLIPLLPTAHFIL